MVGCLFSLVSVSHCDLRLLVLRSTHLHPCSSLIYHISFFFIFCLSYFLINYSTTLTWVFPPIDTHSQLFNLVAEPYKISLRQIVDGWDTSKTNKFSTIVFWI
ncbi:hypothetical protein Patl1_19373 [Pistacia atlantica]|uniref:Uncharacterized protein n=1 Tax=Pistacia atlantica TaxID=434234 RepID=A0ACC1BZE6_9ROSI|nr:hypothetical protein Patl1_19373 [Pistacia atlantica]